MVKDDAAASSGDEDNGNKRRSAYTDRTEKQLKNNRKTFQTVIFDKGDDDDNATANILYNK